MAKRWISAIPGAFAVLNLFRSETCLADGWIANGPIVDVALQS